MKTPKFESLTDGETVAKARRKKTFQLLLEWLDENFNHQIYPDEQLGIIADNWDEVTEYVQNGISSSEKEHSNE